MTLGEMIERLRAATHDLQQPYFWQDAQWAAWLTDAERQACVRGRLLREDSRASVCRIALRPDAHTYALHPSAYEIIHAQIRPASGAARRLYVASREWLDAERPGWRDSDRPAWALIQDERSVRVVGRIADADALELECYRLPLAALESPGDEPEIHEAHHEALLNWALHKAFAVVDAETFDEARSAKAEQEFTRYFGPLPESDLRRRTRHDVVQRSYSDFQWRGR